MCVTMYVFVSQSTTGVHACRLALFMCQGDGSLAIVEVQGASLPSKPLWVHPKNKSQAVSMVLLGADGGPLFPAGAHMHLTWPNNNMVSAAQHDETLSGGLQQAVHVICLGVSVNGPHLRLLSFVIVRRLLGQCIYMMLLTPGRFCKQNACYSPCMDFSTKLSLSKPPCLLQSLCGGRSVSASSVSLSCRWRELCDGQSLVYKDCSALQIHFQ